MFTESMVLGISLCGVVCVILNMTLYKKYLHVTARKHPKYVDATLNVCYWLVVAIICWAIYRILHNPQEDTPTIGDFVVIVVVGSLCLLTPIFWIAKTKQTSRKSSSFTTG